MKYGTGTWLALAQSALGVVCVGLWGAIALDAAGVISLARCGDSCGEKPAFSFSPAPAPKHF